MVDRIKYKKKYKESVQPLGIGDPLVGAGLGGGTRKKAILDSKADKLMGATSLAVASAPGVMIGKGFHDIEQKRKERKKASRRHISEIQKKRQAARYKNVKAKKRSY